MRASKKQKNPKRNILQKPTKKPHTENPKTETFLEKTNKFFICRENCKKKLIEFLSVFVWEIKTFSFI